MKRSKWTLALFTAFTLATSVIAQADVAKTPGQGLKQNGTKFNGAKTDYDGSGRDASDNNTLTAFAWIAF